MGERGPPPKRKDQRRRQNKDSQPEQIKVDGQRFLVEQPEPDDGWHPVAKRWYEALARSGQAIFYEPSDWAMAYMLAESMSRDLHEQVVAVPEKTGEPVYATVPMKGASLQAYLKGMTALLVSEGDRRRAEIELQRTPPEDPEESEKAAIAKLDDYRQRAAG